MDLLRAKMEADPETVAELAWKAMKEGRDVRAITAMLDRNYGHQTAPGTPARTHARETPALGPCLGNKLGSKRLRIAGRRRVITSVLARVPNRDRGVGQICGPRSTRVTYRSGRGTPARPGPISLRILAAAEEA
jgi:hypothetical protein